MKTAYALTLGASVAVTLTASAALPSVTGSPIAPYAKFADGYLTKTTAAGWLREFCERQRTGLTGHPEALSYPYDSTLWVGELARQGDHGFGWWRYEQTAYYTDGLLRLGYVLGDREMIAKAVEGIDYTLDHASPEGYLGNPVLWDSSKYDLPPGEILWPMAVYFRAMKAKYDATGDERIPAALEKYYLLYPAETLANNRNVVSVEGMLWTYSHTGNTDLLALAEKAWGLKEQFGKWRDDMINPESCANDDPLYTHGVTYCELMKVPMLLAAYTGKAEYLQQGVNIERKLVRDHMLPDGCPCTIEQTRGNNVHWGHETCDIVDFTWAVGYALETTGDAKYADEIERCVFNAGPGCVTKDFKTLQYFSNPNQFLACGDSNQNPFFYGSTWQQYRPTHETECCAGTIHRLFPNYISRMWMTDRDGNPVAALYGPSEIDFGFAKIVEKTDYPFDGKLTFVFTMPEAKTFAFTYRTPGWCAAGATVKVNGEPVASVAAPGAFGRIERRFADGDVVELEFPMEVRFEEQPERFYIMKDVVTSYTQKLEARGGSQGTVVTRGPVVYAYPIETETTIDDRHYDNMRGKKSGNPDFKCLAMRPAGPFNFALAAHEAKVVKTEKSGYALDLETVPVAIEVPVRRIDWTLDHDRFTPDMPKVVKPVSETNETIRLVPYGATCLRLTVFPELPRAR